jgi:hypothetical protein
LLGYRSHPNQAVSQAPKFSGEPEPLAFFEDWQGNRPAVLSIEKLRSTRNTSHHSDVTVALKVH